MGGLTLRPTLIIFIEVMLKSHINSYGFATLQCIHVCLWTLLFYDLVTFKNQMQTHLIIYIILLRGFQIELYANANLKEKKIEELDISVMIELLAYLTHV